MSFKYKIALLCAASAAAVIFCIGLGSVYVSPGDIFSVFLNRIAGAPLPDGLPASYPPMILDMRAPRVLLAYITGAALAISGAVMQTLLQNPLASPYGLGVSAGAGLGAALVIVCGAAAFFTPFVSLAFALAVTGLVAVISAKLDRSFSNATIVLIGMVVSLFCTALMSLAGAFNPDYAQRIQLFTLGSFSMKEWSAVLVTLPVTVFMLVFFMRFSREADVMAFGEDQAAAMGVNTSFVKKILLAAVAALTGVAVSFAGIIGFVDLVVPYIARRAAGGVMKRVLPVAALTGGIFMTLCDLAARTLASPREIPIGVITALLGAPFFIYIFFVSKRRRG